MLQWLFGRVFDPDSDIPSLAGKVVLVTGGNNGLGKETVLQLAKHSPKEIFLAARTQSKAEAAIADIKAAVPEANISFLSLDLSSFRSVQRAADTFRARSDRLDILINNAGIAGVPYTLTEDGYEIHLGTNHMGHALLTKLLLPILLKTAEEQDADVRIINVSSSGHKFAAAPGITFDQAALEKQPPLTRYGHSKLANILHARELQRRYPSITATAVHPGVIITDIYASLSEANPAVKLLLPVAKAVATYGVLPDVYDVPGGTLTQLWAAVAERDMVRGSCYWVPVGVKNAGTQYAQDEELAKQLWEWTEEEFAKKGL